jgi:hypothetical protein
MKTLVAVAAILFLVVPPAARAQTGPVTASLSTREPRNVAFRIGPVLISPNLNLPEFGYDSNVFDEDVDPKKDWTVRFTPDLTAYARSGVIQFAVTAGSEFTYFHKYESERSVARQFLGRLDATLSRVKPWVAAAHVELNNRPNREIDARARRTDQELSGGVAFDISSIAALYGMAAFTEGRYATGETFKGLRLDESLNQRGREYAAGFRLQATPFTTLRFEGRTLDTQFIHNPLRNTASEGGRIYIDIAPEAILTGTAHVGFERVDFDDPAVPDFRGVVSGGTMRYTILERATVETTVERRVQYSFEVERQYYVETGVDLVYTQRIRGPLDVQTAGSRRWLDYTRLTPGLRPTVDRYGIGLGYNLQDRSRIGFNFEYAQRVDEMRPDRRYDRRRFFGTFTVQR